MIDNLFKKVIKEEKDVQIDYAEQFEITLKDGDIIVTQLFGYNTKYPIYVKTDGDLKNKLKIDDYDIDVTGVSAIGKGEDIALQIDFNVDTKEKEEVINIRLILANGKESVKEV